MKTVYVLGAGFSVDAGAPTQAAIIREAFRLHRDFPSKYDEAKFSEFTDFIKVQLNVSEENFANVDLEDIFTPLDRCLGESSQFRGISLDKIESPRSN